MTAPLLTLDDVAVRLHHSMNKRTLKVSIKRNAVPYIKAGRMWLMTEDQFAQLREALTCSGSDDLGPAVHITYAGRYGSGRKSAPSASTLQAAVTERLQKPMPTSSRPKSATKSSTAPLRLVRGT
jgi:hypothetical protein